jgi:UDP-N-acetylglucosamine--N-acetylmuramyl-(pentapeptide) pyrophosphoryl-undecaprenol N-acetylglucosamine transferase
MPMAGRSAELPSERCIDMSRVRVVFAGGGTGGHLFPAIALADEIRKTDPDAEILFVGTSTKIEARVVPAAGYQFRTIWISGFHRSFRPRNLLFPVKVVVALFQARSILASYKPDVVVGTGGYVSGPVLRTAMMMRIPTLIQEQNSYPGVTTRALAVKADEVHLTFENSAKYFRRTDNLFFTGNPTRGSLDAVKRQDALKLFGFDPASADKTVLVVGGSLGARTINQAIAQSLGALVKHGCRVIWQTGHDGFDAARRAAAGFSAGSVWVGSFIDRMDCAYAASDLVVCRAGATTIAELTRLGKPSIMVPYPYAAANHQVENARALAAAGAAEVVMDADAGDKLEGAIIKLLSGPGLEAMGRCAAGFGKPDAAKIIAGRILALAHQRRSQMEK